MNAFYSEMTLQTAPTSLQQLAQMTVNDLRSLVVGGWWLFWIG